MAWVAPALTPRSEIVSLKSPCSDLTILLGGNPAFKVYDVDPDTYEIMDAKTYSSMFLKGPLHEMILNITC